MEEVKLAIKPFYQRRDIDKDEYKEILRKAVQKVGSRVVLSPTADQLKTGPELTCATVLCSWSSGVPQQEWGDQPCEGGQSGQGIRGQIQTRKETQERRGLGTGTGGRGWEDL